MTMDTGAVLRMPQGFKWGVATAAHQNEGCNDNNQWAAWENQPGKISRGQRAGAATDWWNLATAEQDLDRAAEMGLNSLRLSVEWSRIEPEPGVFDAVALRQYNSLIGLMRARGLEPMLTLHHFTDPLWFTALGAWENPLAEDYFCRFVTKVVEALGDQVSFWCTINEPFVYAYCGFVDRSFPPGVHSLPRAVRVIRHMLLAHARAYRAIHRLQSGARVGLAHHLRLHLPANPESVADRRVADLMNQISSRAVLDAITAGRWTPLLGMGQSVPLLIDTCDYIGLNYYSTVRTAFDIGRPDRFCARTFLDPTLPHSDLTPRGEAYGEINASGLFQALCSVAKYGKPIYITENGVPDSDDDVRPAFLVGHLAEAWRAVQEGVDLRGYYHWTLVDNFEWAAGWDLRFGLYSLDLLTGTRTATRSAAIYARIAQSNGVPRSLLEQVEPDSVQRYFDQRRATG